MSRLIPAALAGCRLCGSDFLSGPQVSRVNRKLRAAMRVSKPDVVFFDKPIYYPKNTIEGN